jgi:hypothetical protein
MQSKYSLEIPIYCTIRPINMLSGATWYRATRFFLGKFEFQDFKNEDNARSWAGI